ncbi:MAG: PLP-dependent transferase [Cyanobacteria bacterium SID2]|nr:PLP-dependent transferase [Cyanobacteria bacterium SID2]MBP0006708.1 PLP-dependent transferase [Cyanobacteria bacterium SBC]
MNSLELMHREYLLFCETDRSTPDLVGEEVSLAVKAIAVKILAELESDIPDSSDITSYSEYITRQNFRIRNLLLLLRQFWNHLEWSSASYSQSVVPHFFDVRKQEGSIVNYDRWESFAIANLEEELSELYQLNERWSLILTSSGMAAYATIHNYLTRYLSYGDEVLIPVPIYHEAESLLAAVSGIQIVTPGTVNVEEILTSIRSTTKVICLTPITNDESLRFIDVNALMEKLNSIDREILVVFDGTMSGGLIRPEQFVDLNSHVKLLYFESGNKYQQFEDTAMKGIIIVPQALKQEFTSIRREIGTILYDWAACCLPQSISIEELKLKMGRFARNALTIGNRVNNDVDLQNFCTVNYPLDPSHPDFTTARKYFSAQLGGVVTLSFTSQEFYDREKLDRLINRLIDRCQSRRIPFCKGDSYGFSIPRIHIGGSKTDKPFLRLCVGSRSFDETDAFLECLLDCLKSEVATV